MLTPSRRADRVGIAAVAVSAVCFGTLGVFGKLAQRTGVGIPTLLGLRFGLAALLLAVVARVRGERLRQPASRTAALALMGLLYVGQASAFFLSLRTVPAAITSILLYVYPVLVVIVARVLFGEPLTAVRLGALALASGGVLLVVGPSPSGHLDPSGVVAGLTSALVYSVYILAGRRLIGEVPAVVATAHIALVAAICFLAAAVATGSVHGFQAGGWAVIAGLAVIPTVLAATLFLAGLAVVGPSRAAVISTLEPVSTALLAGLLLREGLGSLRLSGGLVVVAAAVILALSRIPEPGETGSARV